MKDLLKQAFRLAYVVCYLNWFERVQHALDGFDLVFLYIFDEKVASPDFFMGPEHFPAFVFDWRILKEVAF